MKFTSPTFEDRGTIPQKYGRDFENINPPLCFEDIPDNTASLVLIMEDPDVPEAAGVPVWDHWVVFNIPPHTKEICEAWSPTGVCGVGTRGELQYAGPRPPDREHRYFFKLYALSAPMALQEGVSKQQVLEALGDHVVATAELMGRFAPTNT